MIAAEHTAATLPPPRPNSSAPLRVCHLSLTLKTGGLERLLADFARLHDASIEPMFVAMQAVGRFAEEIRAGGRDVTALHPGGKLRQLSELTRLLRQRKIDVLHTHNTYPHVWGTIAGRCAGVPVIVQTRHGQRAGHGFSSRVKYRWASHFCDRIVSVSDDAARLCIDADKISPSRVTRIWNGIDAHQFAYFGPASTPTAMSVARLSPEKDFPTLLRATRSVVDRRPDFRLLLVGDGSVRADLEALTRELRLTDNVEFLGERTDVPQLLQRAAFFVSSSLTEGISLTLLEAMAAGLPVVATSVGGNPEIVVANETGLLAPANDPSSLAAAMLSLLNTPERWEPMGRAGRARVEQHFEVRRMVRDYESLYREILATRRPAR